MIDVGERVPLVAATVERPRHSEASVVADAPGSLLLAWSRFSAAEGTPPETSNPGVAAREWAHSRDNNPAVIAFARSSDGGATWGEPWVGVESPAGINVMQPSLLLDGAELVMTYSERNSASDSSRVITRSTDSGLTWSEPSPLVATQGYLTAAHDRLVVLDDGRWIHPAHELRGEWIRTVILLSDDRGASWTLAATLEVSDGTPGHLSGLWEASVAERADGSLLLFGRTATGWIYSSESSDRGQSWTGPVRTHLGAPSAPSLLRRIANDRFALIRDDSYDPDDVMLGVRRPLVLQLSDDGGRTWDDPVTLEHEAPLGYHYPSCLVVGESLILTYSITDPATRLWSLASRVLTLN